MRLLPILLLLLSFVFLFGACTSEPDTRDDNAVKSSPSMLGCDQAADRCKRSCQNSAQGDLAATGPCYNLCLKQAQECRGAAN